MSKTKRVLRLKIEATNLIGIRQAFTWLVPWLSTKALTGTGDFRETKEGPYYSLTVSLKTDDGEAPAEFKPASPAPTLFR